MIGHMEKNAAVAAPPEPEEALPKALTTPYFSQGFKEVLTSFVQKLLKAGVPRDQINKALAEMLPEIQRVATTTTSAFTERVTKYLQRRKWEEVRTDYLGRALLFDIEAHFSTDDEVNEKLLFMPVKGFLPREVAEGLVMALKQAHGTELVHQYEELCAKKKERFRDDVTRLVDVKAFVADDDVKTIVKDITTRFRLLLHKKAESEQRKWLNNLISRSHSFREMKRDLTNEELDIIAQAFLKTKQ